MLSFGHCTVSLAIIYLERCEQLVTLHCMASSRSLSMHF